MSLHSASHTEVASRLGKLAELYKQGQVSDLTTRTLDKLIEYEVSLTQSQLSDLQEDLAAFETRFGRTSSEFYQAYQSGQTDDRMDFVEWASLVQMAENLRRRLEILTAEDAA
jgi:hypothetical protein